MQRFAIYDQHGKDGFGFVLFRGLIPEPGEHKALNWQQFINVQRRERWTRRRALAASGAATPLEIWRFK